MNIIIRKPLRNEAELLAEIHVSCSQETYGITPTSISLNERKKHWTSWLNESDHGVLVIEVDGKIGGFCTVKPSRDDDLNASLVDEMQMVYLQPSIWRNGFGTLLCQKAISNSQENSKKEMIVWVKEDNNRAREFYESLGFQEDNRTIPNKSVIRYCKEFSV